MTHPSDKEKLIEEVAAIVYGTVPASVIVPWRELDQNRRVEFEDAARAIRRLFEKEQGEPSDAQVEAAAQAMFEPDGPGGEYTWAEMVAEDPSRADIWCEDARRVLRVAGGVR